jgi:MFS family permease
MNKSAKTIKDSAAIRWLVLILISGLMFSTYWFQDFFSPLRDLMETDLGINSEEFGRIIGLTTIANMFGMIIIGGIILDKWGIRLAGLAFGGLATLGGAITALASVGYFGEDKSSILTGLIIGRILFGSGLEVVCVVVTRTVVKWFKGYELALAMAINMGFGRLGTALAIAISLDIAGVKVSPAVVFAASLIGLSLILFFVYLFFDVKLDKQEKAIREEALKHKNSKITGRKPDEMVDEDFRFSDLVKLATNKSFIYIALLCVAFYSAVFPFIQYAPDLLLTSLDLVTFCPNLPQ